MSKPKLSMMFDASLNNNTYLNFGPSVYMSDETRNSSCQIDVRYEASMRSKTGKRSRCLFYSDAATTVRDSCLLGDDFLSEEEADDPMRRQKLNGGMYMRKNKPLTSPHWVPPVIPPPSFCRHTLWMFTPPAPVNSQQCFPHMSNREICVFKTLKWSRTQITPDRRSKASQRILSHKEEKNKSWRTEWLLYAAPVLSEMLSQNRVSHTNEKTRCRQASVTTKSPTDTCIMGNITGLVEFYITLRIMWQYDDLIHG